MLHAQPYLITFTPIGRFFFGTSRSFAEGFFVESMRYPKPSTVLGSLRYNILRQNNKSVLNDQGQLTQPIPDDIAQLTGTSQISGLSDTNVDFGVIERLSPAFIVKLATGDEGKIENIYLPVPSDTVLRNGTLFVTGFEERSNVLSSESETGILSTRKRKEYPVRCLGGSAFWKEYVSAKTGQEISNDTVLAENDVFIPAANVGIARENRMTVENMYYMKTDYILQRGFAFGVIIWFRKNPPLKSDMVRLGGEHSVFSMNIQEIREESFLSGHPVVSALFSGDVYTSEIVSCAGTEKIVTLSPLVVEGDIWRHLRHAIIPSIETVRMLKPRLSSSTEKTETSCMIPVGAVLYPQSGMGNAVTSFGRLPNAIGYNRVLKIT